MKVNKMRKVVSQAEVSFFQPKALILFLDIFLSEKTSFDQLLHHFLRLDPSALILPPRNKYKGDIKDDGRILFHPQKMYFKQDLCVYLQPYPNPIHW